MTLIAPVEPPGDTVVTLNSGQLIFKYVFSKLFQSKRLLKHDTYMES